MELTMELTREQIKERLISAKKGNLFSAGIVKELCTALLAEMDKPKVWDEAPRSATHAEVWFGDKYLVSNSPDKIYTRELPKSREREIAEEAIGVDGYTRYEIRGRDLVDIIEGAILQSRKEWEASK